jgi:nucleoside-diphosphate-sugar epimerase
VKVVITGGSGFIGVRLARALLGSGEVALAGAPVDLCVQLVLIDRAAPPADLAADARVRSVVGDLGEYLRRPGVLDDVDLVFHLAAAVSAECESDFDLGMRNNLAVTQSLLEAARAAPGTPMVVFASSLAVFGFVPEQARLATITDFTLPTPQTSYGIQKFIGEQLVADYARKGFIRGRSVRLATVCVRPGQPNGAASSFLSSIIREPLAGKRAICPVPGETEVALSSPDRTIEGLLCAAAAPDDNWGSRTAVNLPSVTLSVAELVAALSRVGGRAAAELIDWEPDPLVAAIVTSWPARFRTQRASELGLSADPDADSILQAYIRRYLQPPALGAASSPSSGAP